jgi:5-methylcytosine-specific restriction enzyme B
MSDALSRLTSIIQAGMSARETDIKPTIDALFGERYYVAGLKDVQIRNAFGLGRVETEGGVPYAGLIHPDNPTSGPYGGTSLVWFPAEEGSLLGLGVGTRGISPDEAILTRPGHRRRTGALRRYLARSGVSAWSKPDPAALGTEVPQVVRAQWPEFSAAFRRYGSEMYCFAKVPVDAKQARLIVQAFFDLYAHERGWKALKQVEEEFNDLLANLRGALFEAPSVNSVTDLLRRRRFVVLQGPPGTGKTRLAELIRKESFGSRGRTIQFHPSVTYEDFVFGLSPDAEKGELRFRTRRGSLLEAAKESEPAPYLLVIDEINRADLGKVLGEAVYLFEADEIGTRTVRLPHPDEGNRTFGIPPNLYVIATMNTADRSIANVDIAIRRRFSFVPVPPDRNVVVDRGIEAATQAFDRIVDVFVEHAPDEALDLIPGHAYFLASDETSFRKRLKYEVLPLLDDYLRQGLLGAAGTELQAVRDSLADQYTGELS